MLRSSLRALSKAAGSSCAPGGIVFLLGLPWGVLTGVMKLLVPPFVGVPVGSTLSLPWEEGKRFAIKLAMVVTHWSAGADDGTTQG